MKKTDEKKEAELKIHQAFQMGSMPVKKEDVKKEEPVEILKKPTVTANRNMGSKFAFTDSDTEEEVEVKPLFPHLA